MSDLTNGDNSKFNFTNEATQSNSNESKSNKSNKSNTNTTTKQSNINHSHDHTSCCGCKPNNLDSEKLAKLAFEIKDFCYNSILGFESGYYKTNKTEVKKNQTKIIASYFIVDYHNQSYKALILDSDKYIVEKYGSMHSIISHSYICLLNITLMVCKYIIDKMIREFLDDSSYPNYMQMVKLQLTMLLDKIHLENMLSHKCTGEDIKKCDPELKIFSIKAREDNTDDK